jgi:DtxR family Mn-dependent transcriptional regulator
MERDGIPLISARVAERLGVSAPTVTATLQRMMRDDLVQMAASKEISLTAAGRGLAEDIVRRHALAERLLTDILGLPWHEAHSEAHKMEHAISGRVEERLMEVLGNPCTCPHGNPIPGRDVVLTGVPLSDIAPGEAVVIERITEDAETDPDLLQYLQKHELRPGKRLQVSDVERFNQLLRVQVESGVVPLGFAAASKIRVNPVDRERPPDR